MAKELHSETTAERKQRELLSAFAADLVHDPISGTALLTSILISTGATLATTALTYFLTPRPKPQQIGNQSGDFQITRAEQGLFIPEVYGGDPGDGIGGSKVGAIVIWTSGLRRHVTTTGGGGKGGGRGGGQTQTVEYDLDLALLWGNNGPYQLRKLFANAETLLNADFADPSNHEAENATLTGATAIVRDTAASRSKAVTLTNPTGKAAFNFLRNNSDTPTYIIFFYKSSASATVEVTINGVTVTETWPSTSGVYLGRDYEAAVTSGGNTASAKVTAGGPITLDYLYAEAGRVDPRDISGRFNSTVAVDDTYTQDAFLNPETAATKPAARYNGEWSFDAASGGSYAATLANSVNLVFYPGNSVQLPDPTIQAEVDARLGAGYTPAYRGKGYSALSQFYLTPYGGVLPTFGAVVEHAVYRTLADICQQWCERVNLLTTEYDFTDFDDVDVRGYRILQGPYAPKGIMETAGEIYDCYFAEQYGQIVGAQRSDSVVATLTSDDIGWQEVGSESDGVSLSGIDASYAPANELPAKVTVRHIDAAKDWESNTQSEARQVVEGVREVTIEGDWTLTPDEARAVAARRLYRAYVEKVSYKFNLYTKYAWLNPGDLIALTTDDGFSYTLRLTAMRGGVGLIECEATPHDSAVFTQPAVGIGGVFEPPPVSVAGQTIGVFLDVPLLREGDATNNNGVGVYVGAVARTGDEQGWPGFGLYRYRNATWELLGAGTQPAIIGRAEGVLADWPYASGIDNTSTIDIDLYGTTATLESVTEAQMLNGANMAVLGGEVLHFQNAVRQGGYDNRWRLTTFLRGVRGTEYAKNDHVTHERFCFVNEAVTFVPLDLSELNVEYSHIFLTGGQDLDDATQLDFTWTGATAKPLSPIVEGSWDEAEENVLITLTPRARLGGVSYAPNFATTAGDERFMIQIPDAVPVRTQLVTNRRDQVAVSVVDPLAYVFNLPGLRIAQQVLSSENSSQQARFDCAGATGTGTLGFRTYYPELPNGNWRDVRLNVARATGPTRTTVTATEAMPDGGGTSTLATYTFTGNVVVDCKIEIRDGIPHFFAALAGSVPEEFAVGVYSITDFRKVRGFAWVFSGATVSDWFLTSNRFDFLYTLEMRTADGTDAIGINALSVEAWQESETVGEGLHAEAII